MNKIIIGCLCALALALGACAGGASATDNSNENTAAIPLVDNSANSKQPYLVYILEVDGMD